jgi:glycerol-3-phosphate O-acyltransferase
MTPWLGLDKLFFSFVRLLLGLLTRASTVPEAPGELSLDPNKPVVFVLRDVSLTDLLAVEREAKRLGISSPLASVKVGDHQLRRGYL